MPLSVKVRRITPERPESFDFLFARKTKELFGMGVAHRISALGENRIEELNNQWLRICAEAQVVDEVGRKSVGLTAFASISFSPESKFESVLVIPKRTVIIEDESYFEILVESENQAPKATKYPTTTFESGAQSAMAFQANVTKAISKIQEGELEKVVLSRDLVMALPGEPDLTKPLAKLRKRYPECWTYKVEAVFGASPELLIRGESGEVSARVLAGTAGRGTDPDVDRAISSGLSHSNKNIHEHAFAVRSMVEELGPFCEWVEADAEPFSLALPDLWHLATDVRGKLKPNTTLLDVVAKLHPTAAVAGTPRDRATKLIAELEQHDRGGYAGPVGWLSNDGSGELAIALRGGIIETSSAGTTIRALAGCGIVAESEPEAELAETELKFRAVRHAFEA